MQRYCGKIPHSSPDAARSQMLHTMRRSGRKVGKGNKVNVYKCAVCDGWHFGRIRQNDKRAR